MGIINLFIMNAFQTVYYHVIKLCSLFCGHQFDQTKSLIGILTFCSDAVTACCPGIADIVIRKHRNRIYVKAIGVAIILGYGFLIPCLVIHTVDIRNLI